MIRISYNCKQCFMCVHSSCTASTKSLWSFLVVSLSWLTVLLNILRPSWCSCWMNCHVLVNISSNEPEVQQFHLFLSRSSSHLSTMMLKWDKLGKIWFQFFRQACALCSIYSSAILCSTIDLYTAITVAFDFR